jgi:cytoskeletal protein CcmA (bactofilin family)
VTRRRIVGIVALKFIKEAKKTGKESASVSTHAVPRIDGQDHPANTPKENWLGFAGDVMKFTGEVRFKSMLRIDGNFSGHVNSSDGTLIVSTSGRVTDAVINVAVARIEGTVEGDIKASKELTLGRTASVTGKLSVHELIIEEGARFNGSCQWI